DGAACTSAARTLAVSVSLPPAVVRAAPRTTLGCSGAAELFTCPPTWTAAAAVATTVNAVAAAFKTSNRTRSSERGRRGLEEAELLEAVTQDLLGVGSEVAAQDLLVHRAEVDLVPQVARRV